jgi:hypothetical protein
MMVIEEMTGGLFPADLYMQWGDQPPIVRENLGKEMCQGYRESGIFTAAGPVLRVVDRIERLDPQWIHPMHGGSLPKDAVPSYTRALREAIREDDTQLRRVVSTIPPSPPTVVALSIHPGA